MKSRDGKSQRKKRRRKKIKKEKAAEERRSRCAKREESPETLCFSNDLWKSRLAKASGAEPSGQMRDEKLHALVARMKKNIKITPHVRSTPLWREAHVEVKSAKN